MKLRQYIRGQERSKFSGWLFTVIIIVYGLVSGFWLLSITGSIFDTIGSISFPNGYFYARLDPADPELNIAFGVINSGFYDLTDMSLQISLDIKYYRNDTGIQTQSRVFTKEVDFQIIKPFERINANITSQVDDFNTSSLTDFDNLANNSKQISYLLYSTIKGFYFLEIVPFSININGFTMYNVYT